MTTPANFTRMLKSLRPPPPVSVSVERVPPVMDLHTGEVFRRPIKRIGTVVWPWTPQTFTDDIAQMIEDIRNRDARDVT